MKQFRFSNIVSTSPPKRSPAKVKKAEKSKKVERPKVMQRRDDCNDNANTASVRETTEEERQDVAAMTPTPEKPPKADEKEPAARAEKDADTLLLRDGASIVASTPYLKELKKEARRLHTMIESLDPETEAEQIESYKGDIATLRGFIVACVAQRNLLPNDTSANLLLSKSLQEDQDKIVERFHEIQRISKGVKASRKKRRKKKRATVTDEDGDDGGEVTVRVEGIMGPPRLSANEDTDVAALPKARTRPLNELVESQEREKAAAAAVAAAAGERINEDHASTWVGHSSLCCGGIDAAVASEEQPVQIIMVPVNKQIGVEQERHDSVCENSTIEHSFGRNCFQCLESPTITTSVNIAPIDEDKDGSVRGAEKQFKAERGRSPLATKTPTLSADEAPAPRIQDKEPMTTTTTTSSEGYFSFFSCGGAPATVTPATLEVQIPTDSMNETDDESFGPSPKASPSVGSKANKHVRSTDLGENESATSDTSDVAFDLGLGVVTAVENPVDDGIIRITKSSDSKDGHSIMTASSDDLDSLDSCLCITDDDEDDEDMLCAEPDTTSVFGVVTQSPRKANFFSDVWKNLRQSNENVEKGGQTQDRGLQDDATTREADIQATKAADAVNEILKKQISSESMDTEAENLKKQRSAEITTTYFHRVTADEDSVPSHYSTATGRRVPYELGVQRSYLRNHQMAPVTVVNVIQDLKQTSHDLGRDFQERTENFGEAIRRTKNGDWFGIQKAYPSIFSLGTLDSLTSK